MDEAKKMEEGVVMRHRDSENDDHSKEETKKTDTNGVGMDSDVKEQTVVKQKSKRVATLDAFRGLTIVVCIYMHIYKLNMY